MPRKSKKSRAATLREAQKAQKAQLDSSSPDETVNEPEQRYRPINRDCEPYWDAFYENPYPSVEDCQRIGQRLGHTPELIRKWFKMARQFTHAPEKEPESEDLQDSSGVEDLGEQDEGLPEFEDNAEGTLYEHFHSILPENPTKKRKRSSTVTASPANTNKGDQEVDPETPKEETRVREPRGPYTKTSRTTIWRNRRHASDIRGFFTSTKNQTQTMHVPEPEPAIIIIESDSESSKTGVKDLGTQ